MPNTFFDTFDSAERVPRDPCASRHQGNPESVDAFKRASKHLTEARAAVLQEIRKAGSAGATSKEIANRLGKHPNEISGRLTELYDKGKGVIYKFGVRDGAAVCFCRDV